MIVKKGLVLLLCLLQAIGLTALMVKLTDFTDQNELQNSDQSWALA